MNFYKILPITFFLLGIILLILGYFGLEKLPEIQSSKVNQRLPFTSTSESTEKWSKNRDKGYLKIYLFNITNMDNYLDEVDDVIKVKEVGPIVYSYNHNITIMDWSNEESVIKFAKFRTYYYEPEMSKISLNASINSVNILAASIIDNVNQYSTFTRYFAESKVNANFKRHGTSLFFTKTVDELLFAGYDASVLASVKPEAAAKYPDGLYGLMHGKNNTDDGIWQIYTGKDDITKLGKIEKWNEISINNCWANTPTTCGYINGSTDGTRFQPGLTPTKNPTVNLYSASLFRPLSMGYKRNYQFKGINVAKYEIEASNFILSIYENSCYCYDQNKLVNGEKLCDYNGLLDISQCRKAPIIISAPHFLYGSPELREAVKGLEPDLTKHDSYVDIDPVTGIVLKGRKRLQINAYVWKSKFGRKDKDTLVPVMWLEEGQEITDEKAVLYYQAIHGLTDKINYVLIACILIGTALIIAALVLTSINIIRSSGNKLDVKKKSDINHNLKYHKASTMPLDEKVKMTTSEKN